MILGGAWEIPQNEQVERVGVNDGVVSPSCSSIFLSAIIALTTPNVPAFLLSVERE